MTAKFSACQGSVEQYRWEAQKVTFTFVSACGRAGEANQ